MKFRRTAMALATAASLVLIPTTAYAGGNSSYDDCRDGKKWNDYKYAPKCECKCDKKDCDKDHREKDRDKDHYTYSKPTPKKERQSTYTGRVLKTN